ncbi:MAG TPA: pyridoxal-phosphate dependent enzyme, partial [Desulfobacteraceae bacterium]|nr:pyridoxal-phosphate dependent enzyme [Desulfobacteraceae bacterium]
MKIDQFPEDIRPYLIPQPEGLMVYSCLGCEAEFATDDLLYTCPRCGSVLMLHNKKEDRLREIDGRTWRKVFDYRRMLNHQPLRGIFRYYELIAPVIPLERIIYLGEGHTPLVKANARLRELAGRDFYFKDEGLNPSASFKDRGMASALSFIHHFARKNGIESMLAICASTGDTSASAALYASYLEDFLRSSVLLPHGKVTEQQLAQPLG